MAYNLIGKNFVPVDVTAKVTGRAKFGADHVARPVEAHLTRREGCGKGPAEGFIVAGKRQRRR